MRRRIGTQQVVARAKTLFFGKFTVIADTQGLVDQLSQSGALDNLTPPLRMALFLGALGFLSAALVSLTSFTRIIIVLSFVRRAMATQEIPPNPVLIGLSLFLTLFVMGPTLETTTEEAVIPYLNDEISGAEAFDIGSGALRQFMLRQTRRQDLALFLSMADVEVYAPEDTPMRALVPAFVISELKTAFLMGFCIYVPFLLVDLVVSTILMSMGMMMMPPVVISTPFKILLFVLADGWHLIARALSSSFA
jgi:flagellar biosynthetic protein FliP